MREHKKNEKIGTVELTSGLLSKEDEEEKSFVEINSHKRSEQKIEWESGNDLYHFVWNSGY